MSPDLLERAQERRRAGTLTFAGKGGARNGRKPFADISALAPTGASIRDALQAVGRSTNLDDAQVVILPTSEKKTAAIANQKVARGLRRHCNTENGEKKPTKNGMPAIENIIIIIIAASHELRFVQSAKSLISSDSKPEFDKEHDHPEGTCTRQYIRDDVKHRRSCRRSARTASPSTTPTTRPKHEAHEMAEYANIRLG